MQESFQITLVVVAGTILFASLVFFIVFSAVMYQKSLTNHQQQYIHLKNKFEKELLQVKLEVKQSTLTKISEEIHDNVGQVLSLVKLNLHQAKNKSKEIQLDDSIELINTAIIGLRNIAHFISSENTKNYVLSELIEKEIKQINATGILEATLEKNANFTDETNPEISLILHRMIQETINNVLKHAHADKLKIYLNQTMNVLTIKIKDNGIGFDSNQASEEGIGLENLKRRAKVIHADLKIKSKINQGTEVIIQLKTEE